MTFAVLNAGCPCGCTSRKVRNFDATRDGFEVMFEELERRALPKPPALHKLIASGGRRQTENRVRFAMMYARA